MKRIYDFLRALFVIFVLGGRRGLNEVSDSMKLSLGCPFSQSERIDFHFDVKKCADESRRMFGRLIKKFEFRVIFIPSKMRSIKD